MNSIEEIYIINNVKKITKKQVSEILGVHTKSLSRWDNEKIKYELSKVCYKVVDIVKQGRGIYFYVKYEEYEQSNDEHLKDIFKVKDVQSLKKYTKRKTESIEKEELMTRCELCKETNVSDTTSKRYDKKLIEKGVLEKMDEFIYICKNKITKKRVIVDKGAYDNFWILNSSIKNKLNQLKIELKNECISHREYDYLRDVYLDELNGDVMYYKISKIVVKYDNYLYKMLMN